MSFKTTASGTAQVTFYLSYVVPPQQLCKYIYINSNVFGILSLGSSALYLLASGPQLTILTLLPGISAATVLCLLFLFLSHVSFTLVFCAWLFLLWLTSTNQNCALPSSTCSRCLCSLSACCVSHFTDPTTTLQSGFCHLSQGQTKKPSNAKPGKRWMGFAPGLRHQSLSSVLELWSPAKNVQG